MQTTDDSKRKMEIELNVKAQKEKAKGKQEAAKIKEYDILIKTDF